MGFLSYESAGIRKSGCRYGSCAGGRGGFRASGSSGALLLSSLLAQPGLVVFLLTGIHDDRHEAVIASAQLGTLSAVDAGLVFINLEPGLVDEARNAVLL